MSATSTFAIISPLTTVPAFLAMTPENTESERLKMAKTACIVCAAVLILFAALGNGIFRIFGITLPAFQIAGGILLLLVSLDNLQAKRSQIQETEEEKIEGIHKSDVAITPLAIPMLSGPGAITTAILLESKAKNFFYDIVLFIIFILISLISYIIFHISVKKAKKVNPIAMNIITRIMGLILAATAIQFIIDGIKSAFFS